MNGLEVGAIVEWTSTSAGVTKTKRGRIEEIVPARCRCPNKVHGHGLSRDHISYVVRSNGRAYWPRVSLLKLIEDTGDALPRSPQ